jgi:hypothetical protein
MRFHQILACGVAALSFSFFALPACAGPCAQNIELLTNRLRVVTQTPTAPESRAATMHRQPTTQSIASAEQNARQLYDIKGATAALNQARDADKANDGADCTRAIEEARRALAVKPEAGTTGTK